MVLLLGLLVLFPFGVMALVAFPALPGITTVFLGAVAAYALWLGTERLRAKRRDSSIGESRDRAPARRLTV
jgi:hypothetical protein